MAANEAVTEESRSVYCDRSIDDDGTDNKASIARQRTAFNSKKARTQIRAYGRSLISPKTKPVI
jgi:hypothetical protein